MMALYRRLLKDIAELQKDPYPNITLHPRDDLHEACLVLTPPDRDLLHLTVMFGCDYPLQAPRVSIQSRVSHPNVFDSYICASILNTSEGYTPAYTLKGICIQLLSFFCSDRIEQEGGGYHVDLKEYRERGSRFAWESRIYRCSCCGFRSKEAQLEDEASSTRYDRSQPALVQSPSSRRRAPILWSALGNAGVGDLSISSRPSDGRQNASRVDIITASGPSNPEQATTIRVPLINRVLALPNEILMLILDELDTTSLIAAARACREIGELIASHDFIRMRELQCFCLKENFMKSQLGIGVSVSGGRAQGSLGSEFDLLSLEAFQQHNVRRSVQGLPFQHWLPLPLSRPHWRSVKTFVEPSLKTLAIAARLPHGLNIHVIYAFMTDIVVKLSNEFKIGWTGTKSSLRHASEKAIESYFSLFHLVLCLAVSEPDIVKEANQEVSRFLRGHTSKESCPNLGHFITLALLSDQGLTSSLALAIIHEAILRNVVWMLDHKGANMPELSYLEPSSASEFRLQRTFEASKTSYRLLMFQALFYKIARPANTPIPKICDNIFDRNGAPPPGTAETLAKDIRHLKTVDSFPEFFGVMGLDYESIKSDFPRFLKETITKSHEKGYSRQPITQGQALALRRVKEPDVECADGVQIDTTTARWGTSFFPNAPKRGGQRRR